MDAPSLAQAASAASAHAIKYAEPLTAACDRFEITTQRERAMFVAQVAIETKHLQDLEEDLYYKDAARLARLYPSNFRNATEARPYVRNSAAFSQLRYQGYHGRGFIQLTWRKAYAAYSKYSGIDYVANPDWLLRPDDAAMSAAWFFTIYSGDCRPYANASDVKTCTRMINGPALMHLAERQEQYSIALGVML